MKFALYLRMSTEGQSDSPETQRQVLGEFARRAGHEIVEEFCDEAMSGGLPANKRPEAARLLATAADRQRHFDGILVIRLDRLCRDADDRMGVLRYLRRHNCPIYTPAGPEEMETPQDRMLQGIKAYVDQYEREITGVRIREHNLALALQGKKPSGYAPLGLTYDKKEKTWSISDRADDARNIFRWYIETGGNAAEVTRRINQTGARGQRGKPFTVQGVLNILANVNYRGQIEYDGRRIDCQDIPRIIPQADLDAADLLLRRRRPMPSRAKSSPCAYSGVLVCAECGAHLHRVKHHNHASRVSGAGAYTYTGYHCPNRAHGLCTTSKVSTRILDRLVGPALSRLLTAIIDTVDLATPEESAPDTRQRDRLQERRRRWVRMHADGIIGYEEMRREVTAIDKDIARLDSERTSAPPPITREVAREKLQQVEGWESVPDDTRREVFILLGISIYLESHPHSIRAIEVTSSLGYPLIRQEFAGYNRRKKRVGV